MSKEFACRWPTGIETLRVRPGHLSHGTLAVSMRMGCGVGGSVHLSPDDAIEVAQALAVERSRIMPECGSATYKCAFFTDHPVSVKQDDIEPGGIELRIGKRSVGLAYLTKDDARRLAMDLLAMTADPE